MTDKTKRIPKIIGLVVAGLVSVLWFLYANANVETMPCGYYHDLPQSLIPVFISLIVFIFILSIVFRDGVFK